MKLHPSQFSGTTDPSKADDWFDEMERSLRAQQVPEGMLTFCKGMPSIGGKALRGFWAGILMLLHGINSVRNSTRSTFPNLPVTLRTWSFYSLSKGACLWLSMSGSLRISAVSLRCVRLEAGLRDDIRLQVSSLGIRNFAELVEKCQRVDDCYKRMATSRNVRTNLPPRNFDRNLAPHSRNFKGNNQPFRNFSHGGGSQNRLNNGWNGNQRQNNAPHFSQGRQGQACPKCGKFHGSEPCRLGGGNCYNYGKPGYLARDCHMGRSGPGQPS
ncbi:hypothetical protein PIB30_077053 [Stylosanthes scabra]|uniref:CCHC-type domain-containing protein n=1 Tax=Stylosanthes scabra TaxID=79078 RepID=A0ABU6XS88_9FABA|nr:hypothetical protein [Stylosanthes scabra]